MKRQCIGHNMRRAVAFIDRHPGCKIIDVALHLLPPDQRTCPSTLSAGYATVHRCMAAGFVKGYQVAVGSGPTHYRLQTTAAGLIACAGEKNR